MARVLVIVPFPLDESGIGRRADQLAAVDLGPGIEFDFRGVRAGPALLDSGHDTGLAEVALAEVGIRAQEEGYDAVCIDTMSDSGVGILRSLLDIPVIGPGRASYLTALMLGDTFSVLTQWDGWIPIYKKGVRDLGLESHLASIRSINMLPDVDNLLGGKEDVVFPLLREAGMACIEEDGAQVICMGSTTMHQAVPYLQDELPVPVINPGPLSYKLAELVLGLGVSHSKRAWPAPNVPKPEMLEAMMEAAARSEQVVA
jgi:Asp/Glu/hydantoin racemase